jgi:hypothetical protein
MHALLRRIPPRALVLALYLLIILFSLVAWRNAW